MKKLIIGAALCGAAFAFAGAANAANGNNNQYDFLYGSTDAFVLGPTASRRHRPATSATDLTCTSIRWVTAAVSLLSRR